MQTGDKVICVEPNGTNNIKFNLEAGKTYTIKDLEQGGAKTIQLEETDLYYYCKRFVLASEAGKNIEVGDTVMCLVSKLEIKQGETYEVLATNNDASIRLLDDNANKTWFVKENFVVVKKAEPKTDGWIPWSGGKCPVSLTDIVVVKLKNGEITDNGTAGYFDWNHADSVGDIVAYRICPSTEETSKVKPTRSILQEAEELINGERAADYGKVSDNFANIAAGWNIIAKDGITPRKVGLMMAWVKICRDLVSPKHDNLVDGAGYFGCIDKMERE